MHSRVMLLGLLFATACGGSTTTPSSSDATGPATPTEEAKPAEPPATKLGRVTLRSIPANLIADAYFWDVAPSPEPEGCVLVSTHPAPDKLQPIAGDVSMSFVSKDKGREKLALEWDPDQSCYSAAKYGKDMSRLDVGGEIVDVNVTGGIVPGFEASIVSSTDFDVVGAETVEGSIDQRMNVTTKGDLSLAWSNSTNPVMRFYLRGKTASLQCVFSAPATTGVVPAALLRQIASEAAEVEYCPDTTCLSDQLIGTQETHVRAGDYDVTVAHETWRPLTLVIQ